MMTPPDLTNTKDYVLKFFDINKEELPLTEETQTRLRDWVHLLAEKSNNSKRFLISFAIDISNKRISPTNYMDYLCNLEIPDPDLPEQCFELIRKRVKTHASSNRYTISPPDNEEIIYASVMTLYHLNEILKLNSQPEISRSKFERLKYEFTDRLTINNIEVLKKDSREVWVLPEAYIKKLKGLPGNTVENICDYIGWRRQIDIGDNKKNEYIYMTYPQDLNLVTSVPSIFNKYWFSEDLYLSCPADKVPNWGMTYNEVTGERDQCVHERIHQPKLEKAASFEVYYLGELRKKINPEPRLTIIQEGFERFNEIKS